MPSKSLRSLDRWHLLDLSTLNEDFCIMSMSNEVQLLAIDSKIVFAWFLSRDS